MSPVGSIVWLTGLSGSGKTSVARHVLATLQTKGVVTHWLDSDVMRHVLTPTPDYSETGRDFFYHALGDIALRAAHAGASVVVSAAAPKARYRQAVRRRCGLFVEVWLQAQQHTLEKRDPKGLYRAFHHGQMPYLPGMGIATYEPPAAAELVFQSENFASHVIAASIVDYCRRYHIWSL